MDRSTPKHEIRKRRRARRCGWKVRLWCTLLAVLPLAATLLLSSLGRRRYLPAGQEYSIAATTYSKSRPVYPYSIIRGGAYTSEELISATRQDPVVAAHYAGFSAERARIVRLDADRQAYVSFRLGSAVYWTRRKVRLHAGEAVLSDGRELARARCGNRISDVPRQPIAPREPDESAWDSPETQPASSQEPGEKRATNPATLLPQSATVADTVARSSIPLPPAYLGTNSTPPFWYSNPAPDISSLIHPRPIESLLTDIIIPWTPYPPPDLVTPPPYAGGVDAVPPFLPGRGPEPPSVLVTQLTVDWPILRPGTGFIYTGSGIVTPPGEMVPPPAYEFPPDVPPDVPPGGTEPPGVTPPPAQPPSNPPSPPPPEGPPSNPATEDHGQGGGDSFSVPEPATVWISAFGVAMLLSGHRCRRIQ